MAVNSVNYSEVAPGHYDPEVSRRYGWDGSATATVVSREFLRRNQAPRTARGLTVKRAPATRPAERPAVAAARAIRDYRAAWRRIRRMAEGGAA